MKTGNLLVMFAALSSAPWTEPGSGSQNMPVDLTFGVMVMWLAVGQAFHLSPHFILDKATCSRHFTKEETKALKLSEMARQQFKLTDAQACSPNRRPIPNYQPPARF